MAGGIRFTVTLPDDSRGRATGRDRAGHDVVGREVGPGIVRPGAAHLEVDARNRVGREPANRRLVRFDTRQYGCRRPPAIEVVAPRAPWPCSGIAAFSAHASVSARPVLVPPWIVSPLRSRALTPTSTPCQFSVCLAKFLELVASSSTCRPSSGTRLYRPSTA